MTFARNLPCVSMSDKRTKILDRDLGTDGSFSASSASLTCVDIDIQAAVDFHDNRRFASKIKIYGTSMARNGDPRYSAERIGNCYHPIYFAVTVSWQFRANGERLCRRNFDTTRDCTRNSCNRTTTSNIFIILVMWRWIQKYSISRALWYCAYKINALIRLRRL